MPSADGMHLRVRDVRPSDAEQVVDIINPIIEPVSIRRSTRLSRSPRNDAISNLFPNAESSRRGTPEDCLVGFQSMEPFADYTRAFHHVGTAKRHAKLRGAYMDKVLIEKLL